ncbi:MAG: nucleotidyltransferase domain-containing protein [Coriobacteriales bacterium]|nr:nucleotidyltransferase domain-containing protein [Coriobacteriales bacterium]
MQYKDFEGDATDLILSTLEEVERAQDVRVLYAVESGSRAWGFASPDSDYDVRFIYVRNERDYLTLKPRRKDTIEWVVDETLDVCGWDLSKTLQLAHKGNLFLFEWANSPVLYLTTKEWRGIWEVVRPYFSPKAAMHSYLGIAHNTNEEFLQGDRVRYKKYLYALRPLLACKHIAQQGTIPPVDFGELVASAADELLLPAIDELLAAKVTMSEKDEGPRIPDIDAFIASALKTYRQVANDLEAQSHSWEPLENVFLNTLGVR